MKKKLTVEEFEELCRRELKSLYNCLYDTPAAKKKTPYWPWVESKLALATKARQPLT